MFQNMQSILLLATGISGMAAIVLAVYWVFKKEAKKRHLEELRRIYESMSPTDPQYNTARALFIAAAISDAATSHNVGVEGGSTGANSSSDGAGDD
jgi:hypothetical protein